MCEEQGFNFGDFNLDFLNFTQTSPLKPSPAALDGLATNFPNKPRRNIKTRELAKRIASTDALLLQLQQLENERNQLHKQLEDFQKSAVEVQSLYEAEKQQRLEWERETHAKQKQCEQLDEELANKHLQYDQLQAMFDESKGPVLYSELAVKFLKLAQKLDEEHALPWQEKGLIEELTRYCKDKNLRVPVLKSPKKPSRRPTPKSEKGVQCELLLEQPELPPPVAKRDQSTQCVVAATRSQGTQHISTTTTRSTSTACFIQKRSVGTCFPEPQPLPPFSEILEELAKWNQISPISPILEPPAAAPTPTPPLANAVSTTTTGTCTYICNVRRQIDYLAPPITIKRSNSRPPSRLMYENIKYEASPLPPHSNGPPAGFPQYTNLSGLPAGAFEEMWHIFGQMLRGLLQSRASSVASSDAVNQQDFHNWMRSFCDSVPVGQPSPPAQQREERVQSPFVPARAEVQQEESEDDDDAELVVSFQRSNLVRPSPRRVSSSPPLKEPIAATHASTQEQTHRNVGTSPISFPTSSFPLPATAATEPPTEPDQNDKIDEIQLIRIPPQPRPTDAATVPTFKKPHTEQQQQQQRPVLHLQLPGTAKEIEKLQRRSNKKRLARQRRKLLRKKSPQPHAADSCRGLSASAAENLAAILKNFKAKNEEQQAELDVAQDSDGRKSVDKELSRGNTPEKQEEGAKELQDKPTLRTTVERLNAVSVMSCEEDSCDAASLGGTLSGGNSSRPRNVAHSLFGSDSEQEDDDASSVQDAKVDVGGTGVQDEEKEGSILGSGSEEEDDDATSVQDAEVHVAGTGVQDEEKDCSVFGSDSEQEDDDATSIQDAEVDVGGTGVQDEEKEGSVFGSGSEQEDDDAMSVKNAEVYVAGTCVQDEEKDCSVFGSGSEQEDDDAPSVKEAEEVETINEDKVKPKEDSKEALAGEESAATTHSVDGTEDAKLELELLSAAAKCGNPQETGVSRSILEDLEISEESDAAVDESKEDCDLVIDEEPSATGHKEECVVDATSTEDVLSSDCSSTTIGCDSSDMEGALEDETNSSATLSPDEEPTGLLPRQQVGKRKRDHDAAKLVPAPAPVPCKRSARLRAKQTKMEIGPHTALIGCVMPVQLGKYTRRQGRPKELPVRQPTKVRGDETADVPSGSECDAPNLGYFREEPSVLESGTLQPVPVATTTTINCDIDCTVGAASTTRTTTKLKMNREEDFSREPRIDERKEGEALKRRRTLSEDDRPFEDDGDNAAMPEVELDPTTREHSTVPNACSYESPASPTPPDADDDVVPPKEIPLELQLANPAKRRHNSVLQRLLGRYCAEQYKTLHALHTKKAAARRTATLKQLTEQLGGYLASAAECADFEAGQLVQRIQRITADVNDTEELIATAVIEVMRDAPVRRRSTECTDATTGSLPCPTVPPQRIAYVLRHLQQLRPSCLSTLLGRIENTLFNCHNVHQLPLSAATNLTQLYLVMIGDPAIGNWPVSPARLFVAKCLYYYNQKAHPLIYEVLCAFPTTLPHREDRSYDRSDALITVLQHLLMSTVYDMNNQELRHKELLSKLRFEYHFEPFKPDRFEVLDNLVDKLRAGRLANIQYAFALLCKRMPPQKVIADVLTARLMPLANEFYALLQESCAYDERAGALLECISVVVKPFPIDTSVQVYLAIFARFLNAVARPPVQEAAVQAIVRLQRFGYISCYNALQHFQPAYDLQPQTKAMLKTFVHRKPLNFWRGLRSSAVTMTAR